MVVFGGSGNHLGPVRWLRGKHEAEDKGSLTLTLALTPSP